MSDTKKPVISAFTLGFGQVSEECMLMKPAGCYWITVSREEDARLLARQCLNARHAAALISVGKHPEDILNPPLADGLAAIPLIELPETSEAVRDLADNLANVLTLTPGVILFFTPDSLWEKLPAEALHTWIKNVQAYVSSQKITLLIITSGSAIQQRRPQLQTLYRYLDGLSHLNQQQDSWDYRISWWANKEGMLTDRTLRLSLSADRFTLINRDEQDTSLTPDDEQFYLAEKSVLEGAPTLSGQWYLFEDNAALYARAQQANAATVVFSLRHTDQIAPLASYIHGLRCSRGGALKIVVREIQTALRYSDERLLLACGVSALVPFSAPVSRLLATLQGIQGHVYNRHVPAELGTLLKSTHPLPEKGYLPPEAFCRSVMRRINNPLLPENGKGILVALHTVPELKSEQALSLCQPRRFGDVVTLAEETIWLFLSSCRYNELDTALKFIFRLPHDEIFSSRQEWYEDLPILSSIRDRIIQASVGLAERPASAADPVQTAPLPGQKNPPTQTPPEETS